MFSEIRSKKFFTGSVAVATVGFLSLLTAGCSSPAPSDLCDNQECIYYVSNQGNLKDLDSSVTFGDLNSVDAQEAILNFTLGYEIYVRTINGEEVYRLTENDDVDSNIALSPDGDFIAYASSDSLTTSEIFIMNSDGSNVKQLTDNRNFNIHPTWSPDGDRLAFSSGAGNDSRIYIMDSDGSNIRRLTNLEGAVSPSWSPDGTQIAFSSGSFTNNIPSGDIYVINVNGANLRRLTSHRANEDFPRWSPNGRSLVFEFGRNELHTINLDGSNRRQIVDETLFAGSPSWSPNGNEIIFSAPSGGLSSFLTGFNRPFKNLQNSYEIYTIRSNGTNLRRLTYNDYAEFEPILVR